jgi:(S)-ureidoglycine aminohydrolase
MFDLGHTRTVRRLDHLLLTPDSFVRAPLPGMRNATAIIHVGPAVGARFTQMTVEFGEDGYLPGSPDQRFVYVIDGELAIDSHRLGAGDFAYIPSRANHAVSALRPCRAAVIEKPYESLESTPTPAFFTGSEKLVASEPLEGDSSIEVRHLIPDKFEFDLAVNVMTYQPGAALPMVESHVMEHGLLMLSGGGIYRLGESWYPVKAGDFIWMAPYCPQWFGALGKKPASYLIYKDWNRYLTSRRGGTDRK